MSLLGEALSALRGRRRHDAAAAAPPAEPLDAELARRLELLCSERADSAHNRSLRSLVEASEARAAGDASLRPETALG